MTRILLSLMFLLGATLMASAGDPVKTTYKVNPAASTVEWTARKVTGKHNGIVNLKEGSLEIKEGILTGGTFTIDMSSIKVLDLSGEYAGKLEGHLKSDDFFNAAQYPTSSLKINEVTAKGNNTYQVKGDLTIRNITKPVTFTSVVMPEGKKYKATANITIDRAQFDVKYGSGSFFDGLGDKTIYDEFDLVVSLIAE